MEIVWTIVIGFFAGMIAKMITPGKGPGGFFMTAVLGIAGSIAAAYLGACRVTRQIKLRLACNSANA